MVMVAYNDFFNINNQLKGSTINNKESNILKNRILSSVKSVIEKDKIKEETNNKKLK